MGRALDRAVAGSPIHQLIAGEAGVGKSRLVAEVASMASARGMRVLIGGCANVGDGSVPYAPFVEALREPRPGAGSGRARDGRRLRADRPRPSRAGARPGHRHRPDDPERIAPGAPARRRPEPAPAAVGDLPGRPRRRGPPLGRSGDEGDRRVPGPPHPVGSDPPGDDLPGGRAAPPASAPAVARRARSQRPGRTDRPGAPRPGRHARAARGDPGRAPVRRPDRSDPPSIGRQPLLHRGAA